MHHGNLNFLINLRTHHLCITILILESEKQNISHYWGNFSGFKGLLGVICFLKKKVCKSDLIQECGVVWKTCLDMLENPDMPYTTCQNISTRGMLTTVDQVFENSWKPARAYIESWDSCSILNLILPWFFWSWVLWQWYRSVV